VSVRLGARGIEVVLLDIEGTTTPVAFVHDVLFPFSRARLGAWIESHASSPELAAIAAELAEERDEDRRQRQAVPPGVPSATPEGRAALLAYAHWLMDRDRKSPGLKRLQGLIWEAGYQAGALQGEVFGDVPAALRRWHEAGVRTAIFSSGSELAQRRLFQSAAGDLTPLVAAFFDTAVGPKRDRSSYERIAAALGVPPGRVLFVSDAIEELEAAAEAGCQPVLSVRPGNPVQPVTTFPSVESFDEIG
jgi:enolase-phosphatase E1